MGSEPIVLLLTGTLEAGGLERFVTQVALEAKKKFYFQPKVLCLRERKGIFVKSLEDSGIVVDVAPSGWERNLRAWVRLLRQIRKLQPDVVHSQVNFSLVQQFLAVRLGSRARFLVTERNCYPLSGFARLRRILQFYFLKLFGVKYSGNSRDVVTYLANQVRYPERRIMVIPNGISIPERSDAMRMEIRTLRGWGQNDFVVGYIARFSSHKGHRFFLEVIHEASKVLGNQLKACLVGDGPERNAVERYGKELGLERRLLFTGVVSNVGDYLQAFDALMLLSEYEGMPNVVLEGMAYGLPVISNPVGNAAELLAGDVGRINRSSKPEVTASVLIELATNPELARQLGVRARERVRLGYSLDTTLTQLKRVYEFD